MKHEKKSTRKSIVLIGPAYPYRGGNALFVSHLYEALTDTSREPHFDVTLINYSLLYPSLLFPGTTQFDKSQSVAMRLPSERLLNSINPFSWFQTAKRIKALKPDLVVFDWWNPFFGPCHYAVSMLLGAEYRNKTLFITENMISHESRAIDRLLTSIGLYYASAFLALSDKVAQDMKPLAASRDSRTIYRSELPIFDFYDVPESASAKKEDFGFAPDNDVLLFFGYVRKYKGLDVLLRAMPQIMRDNPNAKLLVAGEFYDEPEFYTGLIQELGIEHNVKVVNEFISNEEVGRFYNVCDVVMMPYRSGTQSGILSIAYGFQKPVIVTRVGGLAEFVDEEQTGLVVEPESPEAIAQAVKRFWTLRSTIDFAANIHRRVQQNGFGQIHEVFEQILRDIR